MEMQRGKQEFFRERSVFYTSRLIQEQLPAGKKSNTFDLPEVYLIAVLEFVVDGRGNEQYLQDICPSLCCEGGRGKEVRGRKAERKRGRKA